MSACPQCHLRTLLARAAPGRPRFVCYTITLSVLSSSSFISLNFLVSPSVALPIHDAAFNQSSFPGDIVGAKLTLCTTSASCSYTDPVLALRSNHYVQYASGTSSIYHFSYHGLEQVPRTIMTSVQFNQVFWTSLCAHCTVISVVSMGLAAALTDVMDSLLAHPRPL